MNSTLPSESSKIEKKLVILSFSCTEENFEKSNTKIFCDTHFDFFNIFSDTELVKKIRDIPSCIT